MKKKTCAEYGENAVTEHMCQRWLVKFRISNTTFEDEEHFSQPVADKENDFNEK